MRLCEAPGCGVIVRRGRCITHALIVLIDGEERELLDLIETTVRPTITA